MKIFLISDFDEGIQFNSINAESTEKGLGDYKHTTFFKHFTDSLL
jgi:hypothetical protein